MIKTCILFLGLLGGLASCQSQTVPTATVQPAPTEAEARAAVVRHVQAQPNAALYVTDSARVVDVDTKWQVMVPRTDWARRMPNAAAFEVDKQTGAVTTLMVK